MAVPITMSPELKAGAPVELFASSLLPGGGANVLYEPSADGQRFLLLEPVTTATVPLSVILNWTSLVPGAHP